MAQNTILLIAPAIPVWNYNDKLYLDSKFVAGLRVYCAAWPGVIRIAMHTTNIDSSAAFGMIPLAEILPLFELVKLPEGGELQIEHLSGVGCVLASADNHRLHNTYKICHQAGAPLIHDIEYTLKTRIDFVISEGGPIVKMLRTMAWLTRQEFFMRTALRRSNAIQANGLPAFNAYRSVGRNDMVYFDSRITAEVVIAKAHLKTRLAHLRDGGQLRLAFSGRLIRAKGADALLDVAMKLAHIGVNFRLDIFGAGDLEGEMHARIHQYEMGEFVFMRGAVDFKDQLMPFIRESVDVFLCCHRQGDPSCTYIETYGCGVPIAGFANDAHHATLQHVDVGWAVPMNDTQALANLLLHLDKNRAEIIQKSENALTFAAENLFEDTFTRRIVHCQSVMSASSLG